MSEESETPKPPDHSPHSKLDTSLATLVVLESFKNNPSAKAEFTAKLINDPDVKGIIYKSRPRGPYYSKIRAFELKGFLDKMLVDGKPRAFYVKNFGVNIKTLWLRIHQSFEFLVTNPEMIKEFGDTYVNLRHRVDICEENKGNKEIAAVVIRFDTDPECHIKGLIPLKADTLEEPSTDTQSWRKQMDEYLEDGTNIQPLDIKKGVSLSDAERVKLEDELSIIPGVMATVERTRIRIVKYNGE